MINDCTRGKGGDYLRATVRFTQPRAIPARHLQPHLQLNDAIRSHAGYELVEMCRDRDIVLSNNLVKEMYSGTVGFPHHSNIGTPKRRAGGKNAQRKTHLVLDVFLRAARLVW